MARITLKNISHSYIAKARAPEDWALTQVDVEWSDGGAYALLGPSGCGKTTLLNIISGLVRPTHGQVLFNDADLTDVPTDRRHIAQVFQFPVVYDTMTVYDNLAFPLRNRGLRSSEIETRVREIARMLDLNDLLAKRASGLTADRKQKISLGRGLVRSDVNVIMFDEPLTVIDPHLKWLLRSKLKELHQRVARTMIYVTHDQTEALTFADKVVVMHEGTVVQVGSPVELFERPRHTFVGHFIGSPGMNVLPCNIENGTAYLGARPVQIQNPPASTLNGKRLEIGVRPEFVSFAPEGIPVRVVKVSDAGRHRIVEVRHNDSSIKLLVADGAPVATGITCVRFEPAHTRLYADGRLVE
jgi:glycerol transport system ATP-binding protein